MYNYVYRTYASNNPGGIDINLGYYALAECILNEKAHPSAVLLRWCGLWFDKEKERKEYEKPIPAPRTGAKTKKILAIYKRNPRTKNRRIAEIVGCTPEMVGKVLHKIGVRRNRWDNYISKDKRYSKEKRRKKDESV